MTKEQSYRIELRLQSMPSANWQGYYAQMFEQGFKAGFEFRGGCDAEDLALLKKKESRMQELEILVHGHMEKMRPLLDEWSKLNEVGS